MVESGFEKNKEAELTTLSAYSNSVVKISGCQNPDSRFLEKIFCHHAFSLNPERNKIGIHSEEWICSKLLFEEGGFGYVVVNLPEESTQKISVHINPRYLSTNLELSPKTDLE